MAALEKQFEQELMKKCEQAEKQYGCNAKRMVLNIEKFGGVKIMKELIRKNRTSDTFEKLQEEGQLSLTLEASVVAGKYAALFEDEEVNACYELLCEYGYY